MTKKRLTLVFSIIMSGISAGDPIDQLGGHWRFDDPITLAEVSRFDVSNPIGGSAQYSGESGFSIEGVTGSAVSLNLVGVDDVIGLPGQTLNGAKDFTISLWFKGDNSGTNLVNYSTLINSLNNANVGTFGIHWISGKLHAFVRNTRDDSQQPDFRYVSQTDHFLDNNWHHVVFTRKILEPGKSELTLYVDGTGTSTIYQTPHASDPIEVHNRGLAVAQELDTLLPQDLGTFHNPNGASSSQRFAGEIDDIRIYRRCITPDEIWHLSKVVSGWWPFDPRPPLTNSGTLTVDWSGFNHHATMNNVTLSTPSGLDAHFFFADPSDPNEDSENYNHNDVVGVPGSALNGSKDFTVSLWMKGNQSDNMTNYISLLTTFNSSGDNTIGLQWNNQKLYAFVRNPRQDVQGPNFGIVSATQSYLDDSWHHVVFVRKVLANDDSELSLYVDGVSVTASPILYSTPASGDPVDIHERGFALGQELDALLPMNLENFSHSNQGSIDQRFVGEMDDVRLFKSALTSADVGTLYASSDSAFLGPATPVASNVVVSKIGSNPKNDQNLQFVELFNRGETDVNLSGYSIPGLGYTFGTSSIIKAGNALIVTKNQNQFETEWPPVIVDPNIEPSIAVIPDTQFYTGTRRSIGIEIQELLEHDTEPEKRSTFLKMTKYLVSLDGRVVNIDGVNKTLEISYAHQVGDIVYGAPAGPESNNPTSDNFIERQWDRATDAMDEFWRGSGPPIPHSVVMGNHDTPFDTFWTAQDSLAPLADSPPVRDSWTGTELEWLTFTNGYYESGVNTKTYVNTFGPSRYGAGSENEKDWWGGASMAHNPDYSISDQQTMYSGPGQAQYYFVKVGHRVFLHLNIPWQWTWTNPGSLPADEWVGGRNLQFSDQNPLVLWALDIIDTFPQYPVIVSIHNYYHLPEALKTHPRVFLTLHGDRGDPDILGPFEESHLIGQFPVPFEDNRLMIQADWQKSSMEWTPPDNVTMESFIRNHVHRRGWMYLARFIEAENAIHVERIAPALTETYPTELTPPLSPPTELENFEFGQEWKPNGQDAFESAFTPAFWNSNIVRDLGPEYRWEVSFDARFGTLVTPEKLVGDWGSATLGSEGPLVLLNAGGEIVSQAEYSGDLFGAAGVIGIKDPDAFFPPEHEKGNPTALSNWEEKPYPFAVTNRP